MLKMTGLGTSPTWNVPVVLTDRPAGGAELIADLPLGDLADGRWRPGLLLPAAREGRSVALALTLRADGGTVVVEPVAAVAKSPAPARRSMLRRLAGRVRRALRTYKK
jgi:hypothetical protein